MRVLKQVSNNASIEFYNSALQGVRDYHKTVLAGVEINKCKLAPPPKVLLNVKNIRIVQNAILETYKNSYQSKNPYRILKSYEGKHFAIIHDGIEKFSKELLGVFIRPATTASKSIEIVNVPWCLNQVYGGYLNTDKLVEHLTDGITKIRPVQNNPFEEIIIKLENILKRENKFVKSSTNPPIFFKGCKLENVTATECCYSINQKYSSSC